MHKKKLTPAEVRAYRRLARAAREVERLETLRRKRSVAKSLGNVMRGDDPRPARKGVSDAQ